jgi:hypothetical protein
MDAAIEMLLVSFEASGVLALPADRQRLRGWSDQQFTRQARRPFTPPLEWCTVSSVGLPHLCCYLFHEASQAPLIPPSS